jgi:GntR family transcriptional regulator
MQSVRQLGRDLGIAPNTVVRAYNELEREGWVVTSTRRNVLTTMQQLGVSLEDVYAEIDRQAGVTQKNYSG